MATVDVIIPAFNAANYLPDAIESVISQTFDDWHIVLVDDGSTDNIAEVVELYRRLLPGKFSFIRQENRGLPAARNAAIRASSSEFLALLDADDIWLPCRLEKSVLALRNNPAAGLAYGLITEIDVEGRHGATWIGNSTGISGCIAPYIYTRRVNLPCPTITFRRKCIQTVGFFDEKMRATEDRDLWLRIALQYEVAFVPSVLAYYRLSPNSMSADLGRMLSAQMHFIRKHYGAAGCGLGPRQIAYSRVYKQHAEALKLRGKAGSALVSALQSIALYPFAQENYRTTASMLFNWILRLGRH